MTDREIDEILARAASSPDEVEPALLDRVSSTIRSSLSPVRPLRPAWVLAAGLLLISAGVALGGAAGLGPYGVRKLSAFEIAAIFPVLGIFTLLAAMVSIGEMTPGARRRTAPGYLLLIGSLTIAGVFALLFHDYQMIRFVPRGLSCLTVGLLHALPAGFASWLLLRRGFAVKPLAAGLAMGTLAGLAGVTMLELHCPNLETMHVILWHTAVIPVSGLVGVLPGWVVKRST